MCIRDSPVRLEFYDAEELTKIVLKNAGKLSMQMSADGAREIARRARGTPRVAGRLLRRVRDLAEDAGAISIDRSAADAALTRLGVDDIGLDQQDMRYLSTLCEKFGGGPVGAGTLSAALSEARDALEDVIEPYLIQQGFLQRTPQGRVATARAWKHLGLAAPMKPAAPTLFDSSDLNGDGTDG